MTFYDPPPSNTPDTHTMKPHFSFFAVLASAAFAAAVPVTSGCASRGTRLCEYADSICI